MNLTRRVGVRTKLWLRDSNIIRCGIRYACCRYCNIEFKLKSLTIDHVIPKSKGGSNKLENLVLSCFICNNKKGNDLLNKPFFWNSSNN